MKLGMRVLPGVRTVGAQIPVFAAAWRQHNEVALSSGRSLWVALGDSTAQGIGASSIDGSYVGVLSTRLGQRFCVVNLSATGARVRDVLGPQLEALHALARPAALVTCSVGSNDLLRGTSPARLRREYAQLAEALSGCAERVVVATAPTSAISLSGRAANAAIRRAAAAHECAVADINAHFRGPYFRKLAPDRFHPNDRGYRDWADAFSEALATSDR